MPYATMSSFHNAEVTTKVIDNVNKGSVSRYPYKISDSISVANAHAQYYQLNPENSQITSYYALGNKETSSGVTDAGMYSSSPRDGLNNYYLYQNENVIYSGMGNTTNIGDDELKLFVNTLVMAANMYSANAMAPKIEAQDAISINDDLTCLYVDVDEDYKLIEYRDTDIMEVTFKVTDVLLAQNVTASVYLLDKVNDSDRALEEAMGVDVPAENELASYLQNYVIYDATGSALTETGGKYTLESGKWYTIRYKLNDYKSVNKRTVYIEATASFNGKSKTKDQEVALKQRT